MQSTDLLWYVSYASNLSQQRFGVYLGGGRVAGNKHTYVACTDATPPRQIMPITLDRPLYFAVGSEVWPGGIAFVGAASGAETIARAYLITFAQFQHVVAQENLCERAVDLPMQTAIRHSHVQLPDMQPYDELIYCGEQTGYPMFTFSSAQSRAHLKPTAAYLRVIGNGLRDMGFGTDHIVNYLLTKDGIAGNLTCAELMQLYTESTAAQPNLVPSAPAPSPII